MEQDWINNPNEANCWKVHLLPFDKEEKKIVDIPAFQEQCLQENIFGMGWPPTKEEVKKEFLVNVQEFTSETKLTSDTKEIYINAFKGSGWERGLKTAIDQFSKIKQGDFIIMRLKNSHYYVGRVVSDGAIYLHQKNDGISLNSPYQYFSWGGIVDKWVDYENVTHVPSGIVGYFSRSWQRTIQRVADENKQILIKAMYKLRCANDHGKMDLDGFPIVINEKNYVNNLDPSELEDLVALYIDKEHHEEGYRLLPSSCKNNQMKYEFVFVSRENKPITCQVKNQINEPFDKFLENYKNENSFERIYLFVGNWEEAWSEKLAKNDQLLQIITPIELYSFLQVSDNSNVFKKLNNKAFYHFEDDL